MQNAHYIPHHHYHHQKKALSPHMATSPSMPTAQNIPISHAWSSPGHVPVQSHQAYVSLLIKKYVLYDHAVTHLLFM